MTFPANAIVFMRLQPMVRWSILLLSLATMTTLAALAAAADPTTAERSEKTDSRDTAKQPEKPRLDPAKIYRFDPLLDRYEPLDAKAVKPDHVYYRYSPSQSRWVWSKATADKRLAYAMGPGSVQPTLLFDLTATAEERARTLEARAPNIARLFVVQGARAAVRLTPDGTWTLQGVSEVAQVYDLETGQRWEWHGDRRIPVTNLGGNRWRWHEDRLVPAGYGQVHAFDWCE
jgi:hypothetical protein